MRETASSRAVTIPVLDDKCWTPRELTVAPLVPMVRPGGSRGGQQITKADQIMRQIK
jgi:hypothetical protein